jgi:hypothetical protein
VTRNLSAVQSGNPQIARSSAFARSRYLVSLVRSQMSPSVCIRRQKRRAISSGAAGPSEDLGGRTSGSAAALVSRRVVHPGRVQRRQIQQTIGLFLYFSIRLPCGAAPIECLTGAFDSRFCRHQTRPLFGKPRQHIETDAIKLAGRGHSALSAAMRRPDKNSSRSAARRSCAALGTR